MKDGSVGGQGNRESVVMDSFTGKQSAFIDWYVITLNGTLSARNAGYKGDDNTLGVVAYENLRKPKIKAEIERRFSELAMSAQEALYRTKKIAEGDLSKYIYPDGSIDIQAIKDDGNGALLKKYKRTRNISVDKNGTENERETVEFELYPADAALDKILRATGAYGPRGTEDDPIQHRVKFIDYGLNTDDTDTD